jgi:hypothetical protein
MQVCMLTNMSVAFLLPPVSQIPLHISGLVPGTLLRDQEPEDMIKMRNLEERATVDASTSKWVAHEKGEGVAWASQYSGPEHVIYGHDAKRGFIQHPFATGLDSGCCYGGELTAVMLPSRQFVQMESSIPISKRKKKHKSKPPGIKSRLIKGDPGIMRGVPARNSDCTIFNTHH